MNDIILSAVITAFCTAILGFFAFLFSQIYYKSIQRYKELKARTIHALIYYANVYGNPIDLAEMENGRLPKKHEDAGCELRRLAADWKAFIVLKSKPGICIPKNTKLQDVSSNLIGLSNGMDYYNSKDPDMISHNIGLATKIEKLLGI